MGPIQILFFGDILKPLFKRMKFNVIVILRIFITIIRFGYKIKIVELDYNNRNLFTNSFLVIQYKIKNSLYVKLNDGKSTTNRNFIVVDLSTIEDGPMYLKIRGLFYQKKVEIKYRIEHHLDSSSFKIPSLNTSKEIEYKIPEMNFHFSTNIHSPKITFNQLNLVINHSDFNNK